MSRAIQVFRTGSLLAQWVMTIYPKATVSVGVGLYIKDFFLSIQIHKVHHNETH